MPAKTALMTCLVVLGLSLTSPVEAQRGSFAIRAGRIMPVSADLPWTIDGGILVVRDGWIVAVGDDVEVPVDLPLIELPDATIVPGLVAAASGLGGAHRGDESIAAAYRALDAFDRYGDFQRMLAAGVTTAHVSSGEHRLLTGQGAVVKLGGNPVRRVLSPSADLVINLGTPRPPVDVTYSFPASADVAIPPAERQRPASRVGQFQALELAVRAALAAESPEHDVQRTALANTWQLNMPLRISARRSADLLGGLAFLRQMERTGYLVGADDADLVADAIRQAGVPIVIQPRDRFTTAGGDVGVDPAADPQRQSDYRNLEGIRLALAPPPGQPLEQTRLIALQAARRGLDRRRALEAITRIPAEILGVGDRVGSLEPGKDADFLVMSGPPLDVSSHVLQVFVQGESVFAPRGPSPLVVKAATVWASPDRQIRDGEILVEDGKIVAVGHSVPHPPRARVIDVRADGFVAPGLIDGFSHLGLEGDRTSVDNSLRFSNLIGAADVTDQRVSRAGVTTVMLAPYAVGSSGAPMAAIKTAGRHREVRVVEDPAAVLFDVSSLDPLAVAETLERPLAAGKKYLDAWKKYEKDLQEFLEKQKQGKSTDDSSETKVEETREAKKADPVTGIWEAEIRDTPVADLITLTIEMQLIRSEVAGRIIDSNMGVNGSLNGSFDGQHLSAVVEVQGVDVPGPIRLEVDLVAEDKFSGTVGAEGIVFPIQGRRVDKRPVEIKVSRRRLRGKDGRPLPPKVEPEQEVLKALLEKKIPAVVRVASPAQVREVLDVLVDKHEVPVTLLDASGMPVLDKRLADKKVPVIVPAEVVRTREHRDFVPADSLARSGVAVVFQSDVEDGARHLPSVVLHAVVHGLDADKALESLTIGAARAFKIEDRVGSIAAGKDADLVIFNGHPFREGGQVMRVIVAGEEVQE